MPAFVLSMGKGTPKLKEAAGSGDTGCKRVAPAPQPGVIPNTGLRRSTVGPQRRGVAFRRC
jgi:hypothetical protein